MLLVALGCGGVGGGPPVQELSEEDRAGHGYQVGDTVNAPFGKSTRKTQGKVVAVYGKLVQVQYPNRHIGWSLVKQAEPVGAIQPHPADDTCSYAVGDAIRAPWSYQKQLFVGTIDEVYGKLAHIQYKDGDQDWVACDLIQAPAAPPPPQPAGTAGSSGTCAFKPDAGKYVACTTFSNGKCISGSRACQPAGGCVYSPKAGKHVKCSTFSKGKCISGSRACEPPGKCAFLPSKNKYVVCQTFTGGRCKSGSRSCTP